MLHKVDGLDVLGADTDWVGSAVIEDEPVISSPADGVRGSDGFKNFRAELVAHFTYMQRKEGGG